MFQTMLTYGTVNMQEGVSNDSEVLIILTALISVLHQSGCLRDFMLLVTQLAEG